MADSAFPLLFSPVRLGQREAPNRIVSTSHGTNMAVGGAPAEQLIAYHAEKAKGGCGTVMMFGSAAASALTPIAPNHVNLWDAAAVPGLTAAADAVKAHGALAISQVAALGRRTNAHVDMLGRGPSDTVSEISFQVPHVLSVAEIQHFVEDYAAACRRLQECGFDGADLAFYDDQLPDQFWNPSINKRTDRYGGSLENRLRFSLQSILSACSASGVCSARTRNSSVMVPAIGRRIRTTARGAWSARHSVTTVCTASSMARRSAYVSARPIFHAARSRHAIA